MSDPTIPPTTPVAIADPAPVKPWYKRKPALIGGGILAVLIIMGIGGAIAGGDEDTTPAAAESAAAAPVKTVEAEPVVEQVNVPALERITVAEARAKLEALGLTATTTGADTDIVTTYQPRGAVAPGSAVELTSEAPKPVFTLAQQNAINKAQSYLNYAGFSRQGLIDQLVFEGYTADEATFGADNAGADWNAEAAEKAQSYMSYSSFSRQGLADQLAFENFTPDQIAAGLAAVGY